MRSLNKLLYLVFILFLILLSCIKREWNNPYENVQIYNHEYFSFLDNRDYHIYKAIQIGNQVWMAENLNYDSDSGTWIYNNNSANAATYGRLYDWETASSVCPDGWHLPSDAEWTILTEFLGGESIAGGKMKETGTMHWNDPNTGATNSSGFLALPGGYITKYGSFAVMGTYAHFWSSTERYSGHAWHRQLVNCNEDLYRSDCELNYGYSVRCIRD
ncbi:FISUMP domain-containing protein [Bacteroidota bacterium]